MQYRSFGNTRLKVSDIGYGAWGIGKAMWVGADDSESLRSLHAARDAGVNFFDTALVYGDGHSEQLIARAFGDSRDVVIASKVPPRDYVWDVKPGSPIHRTFPREHVFASLEKTLRNLGREQIDIYQFHTWHDDWAREPEWLETVRDLKSSGKVRFVGISIQNHQPVNVLKALDAGLIDCVQVIYNIFDQSPEDELFPYCKQHGIGVIVRVPFDEGALTGKLNPETKFPAGDFRINYFSGNRKQEVWDAVQRIVRDTGITLDGLPALALRFSLTPTAVSTVIPGMRNVRHVAANVAASDAGPLPPEMVAKLRAHRWVRNFWH
ncbi:MAG TPA: aldo/keto reductase [Candidatus Eisenbacteria bacterium]|nr:aldo/keto reductase [Candidatus Eisenbacteria bacterium]